MVLNARTPDFVCEQQMRRPACVSAQSDQHSCYMLYGTYYNFTCYKHYFNVLAEQTRLFFSLRGTPKTGCFLHDQLMCQLIRKQYRYISNKIDRHDHLCSFVSAFAVHML